MTANATFYQGEPVQQSVTDSQRTSYDMFNVHAISETWLKKNLFFSTGYRSPIWTITFPGATSTAMTLAWAILPTRAMVWATPA